MSDRAARLLALLPALVTAGFIYTLGVDVPAWDQWELIPLLEHPVAWTERARQLFEQHNEHRLVFPRLIMLGLANVTHWNTRFEMAAVWLFAALIVWVVGRRLADEHAPKVALPVVSLLAFSLVAHHNWLWGWQLQIPLSVLCVVGGLHLLTGPQLPWWRVALAALLGIVGHYSFANGVLFWPLAIAATAVRHPGKRAAIAFLAVVAAVAIVAYLRGYHPPEHHPPVKFALYHPHLTVAYILVYLGMSLESGGPAVAAALGLAGVVAFARLAWTTWRTQVDRRGEITFAAGLAGYAIASATITAVGRVGFTINQATSNRYVTISMLLWMALVMVSVRKPRARWFLVGIAALSIVAQCTALPGALRWAREQRTARAALLTEQREHYHLLYPDPNLVAERRPILKALGLSSFRTR